MIGQLAAQSFQTVHDLGAEDEAMEVIELSNKRFLISGSSSINSDNWSPYYDNAFIAVIDSAGAIIANKPVLNFYPRGMFLVSDTIILIGKQIITSSGYNGIAIYQLDTALNIIQSSVYSQNNYSIVSGTSNLNILSKMINLVSPKYNVNTKKGYSVIFSYNIQQNTYNSLVYDSTSFGIPIASYSSSNKTFVYQFIRSGQSSSYPGLVTINNTGQVLSTKRISTGLFNQFIFPDTMFLSSPSGIKKYQHQYYLLGGIDNPNINTVSLPVYNFQDYALIVLDSNLNRIGVSIIGSPDSADAPAYNGMVFKNNSLFIGGTKNWWFNDYYKPEASFIRVSEHNLNGTFIQERFYSTGNFLKLNTIKGTSDGGFILVGSSYDSLGAHQNGLDLFIMKLDSMGNLTGINGKKADEMSSLNFAVYPNPATENISFQKINQFQSYTLEIFDITGKKMNSYIWKNDILNVEIGNFKTGMYLYRIVNKRGEIFQGKFIKE